MVEYSLDLDIPDFVFDDPVVKAMSDATSDIMTWPNVCLSTFFSEWRKINLMRNRISALSTFVMLYGSI